MDKREDLLLRLNTIAQNNESLYKGLEDVSVRFNRMAAAAEQADTVIDDIQEQFLSATKLKTIDVGFLFTAVALQVVRQYLLTPMTKRMGNQESGDKVKDTKPVKWLGMNEEHSNRRHRYYNPSLEEIITNPVPYDANCGADGALKGGGHLGHRSMTLGHDPILGLYFGTSNIATATLTNARLESFHITTENKRDWFKNRASTVRIFNECCDKLLNQGMEGKEKIAMSLIKEVIHLCSDLYTIDSLPFPVVSGLDPKMASELAKYGLDCANITDVSVQGTVTVLINWLIAMLHGTLWLVNQEEDKKLYQARTHKILMYSNLIATTSNVVAVAAAEGIAVYTKSEKLGKEALRYLDIGGLMVTVHRIATDSKFIYEVEREFMARQWYDYVESMTKGDL